VENVTRFQPGDEVFGTCRALLRDPGAQLLTDERGEQLRAKLAVDVGADLVIDYTTSARLGQL
jgi:hypothetical protein